MIFKKATKFKESRTNLNQKLFDFQSTYFLKRAKYAMCSLQICACPRITYGALLQIVLGGRLFETCANLLKMVIGWALIQDVR